MSDWVKRDLRCPEGHYEIGVLLRRSDPNIPRCPTEGCGRLRRTFYATREQEAEARELSYGGAGVFRPVTIEGRTYHTKEDFDRFRAAFARNNHVAVEDVQLVSNSDRVQRAETLFHRGWEGRRQRGFDDSMLRDYQNEQRRLTEERRQRR